MRVTGQKLDPHHRSTKRDIDFFHNALAVLSTFPQLDSNKGRVDRYQTLKEFELPARPFLSALVEARAKSLWQALVHFHFGKIQQATYLFSLGQVIVYLLIQPVVHEIIADIVILRNLMHGVC